MEYKYYSPLAKDSSLLNQLQDLEEYNKKYQERLEALAQLAKRAGLTELEQHLSHSIDNIERSTLWLQAGISSIENY